MQPRAIKLFNPSTNPMMMGLIVWALVLSPVTTPVQASAQEQGKVYRIGYLGARSASPDTEAAFRQGLHDLGYVEGKNLVIEYRYAGLVERPLGELAAELAAELMHLEVDVMVISPDPAVIRAARAVTRTTPIVMPYTVVDPVEAGFVQSLARPGGNITGLTNLETGLYAKRLELLKELLPRISRVAALWSVDASQRDMKAVEAAGKALGIEIQPLVLTALRLRSLEKAFAVLSRTRPGALLVSPSGFIRRHGERIVDFTVEKRLPTMFSRGYFVDAGGLISYGVDHADLYRRAAIYADKILKGAKPGDLSIEPPEKFELFVNLKTAGKLRLSMPRSIRQRANKVIR